MSSQVRQPAFALAAPLANKSNVPLGRPEHQKCQIHSARGVKKRAQGRIHSVGDVSATINSGISNPNDKSLPGNAYSPTDQEALLLDDDDRAFAKWAASAEREEEGKGTVDRNEDVLQIESLLGIDGGRDRTVPGLDDDQLILGSEFGDESDDDDDEDEDDIDERNGDEDYEDDEEEDEELAARASADDDDDEDDDDIHIDANEREAPLSSSTSVNVGGVETDEEDDVADEEEILEPISDDITSIFDEQPNKVVSEVNLDDDPAPADLEAEEDIELFEESEEDIQNAATILSNSGLLGLGVEGGTRADVSAVTSFAMGDEELPKGETGTVTRKSIGEETLAIDAEDEDEEEEEEDGPIDEADERDGGLDSYVDTDESEEEGDFALTSQTSFGKVWELNDDNYVTITEPGQSYMYELDEEDAEDQELASVRRGKQGGWSGGLASYSTKLPEGSKEWVARKAYELLAKTNQTELFQWTRRHKNPPPVIDALFPDDPPAPPKMPKTRLELSTPSTTGPTIGTDSSWTSDEDAVVDSPPTEPTPTAQVQNALEKSVKFPCQFKFKVEGGDGSDGGEGSENAFEVSLAQDLEMILGRPFDHTQFQVEPSGRYKRVIMMVEVENAQQVTAVYDTLRNNPFVKFSYG